MLAGQQAVGETLDWRVDWSTWLGSDTISTSDWTADTGVTLGTESNTTTVATQFISGGAVGRSYQLTNTITTAGGRTAKRTMTVAFVERKTE